MPDDKIERFAASSQLAVVRKTSATIQAKLAANSSMPGQNGIL